MTGRWVLNASPIICLARAGYHQLLNELPEQVVVPEAVVAEVNAGKCAKALGIPVKGTLSIVLTARKRGIISSAAEVLRALQAARGKLRSPEDKSPG